LHHDFAQALHRPTWLATHAERAVSRALGGSCSMPLAAYASWDGSALPTLTLCAALGHAGDLHRPLLKTVVRGQPADEAQARQMGEQAARALSEAGAAEYLSASKA
jgi:hydroxymethylbilane synthase